MITSSSLASSVSSSSLASVASATSTSSTGGIMYVTKRNGTQEEVSFDKILNRLRTLGQKAHIKINYQELSIKVINQMFDGISTSKLDELAAEQCASMSTQHPDFGVLAGRILVSNFHKNTLPSFSTVVQQLYECNQASPILSRELYDFVCQHADALDAMLDHSRDYLFDYFGFKTLEHSYLLKYQGRMFERPQHMWMRVAVGIHGCSKTTKEEDEEAKEKEDEEANNKAAEEANNKAAEEANEKAAMLARIRETYDLMSTKCFTHATPTLFNAGTPRPQMSSCYLLGMENDSIEGIFNTLKDCALISKYSGGIGLHIHNIRSKGSHINGSNGTTDGIVPMLRVFNNTARYVNQAGKRNGSFAIYLEPWHSDVFDFLEMKKNHGDEETKARDLFYALWIPDLFMRRVKMKDGMWSLFCPRECQHLHNCFGAEFDALYEQYEREGRARQTISARKLWLAILDSQMETGTPYLLYKDAANAKSNQKNVGVIKSSNLCVAPETLVLTEEGHVPIAQLAAAGRPTTVWNGCQWSQVTVVKTGEQQPLFEVTTSDGCTLVCTEYHKFYLQSQPTEPVPLHQLQVGDALEQCSWPVLNGKHTDVDPLNRMDCVPPSNASWDVKHRWLVQFVQQSDPTTITNDKGLWLLRHDNVALLKSLKLLLQTCGVHCSVSNDGRLTANHEEVLAACQPNQPPPKNERATAAAFTPPIIITRITPLDRCDDTYCFSEPQRNRGVFNGLLTGQCCEIMEYSDSTETAVCNLASIALPSCVDVQTQSFNFDKLHHIAKVVTNNLNSIIDLNFYPTAKTGISNRRHRPIGIGVQGLADTFVMLDLAFHSEEAKRLNKHIFETIYHAAVEKSMELSRERGQWLTSMYQPHQRSKVMDAIDQEEHHAVLARLESATPCDYVGAYSTFEGSPCSQGLLQFDLWNVVPDSERYDWVSLKENVRRFGMRNSLLVAPMPTASTSQILGYNECFEPFTSNLYSRKTLAGEFVVVNKYLLNELIALGLWNETIKNNIVEHKGSVQQLTMLPQHVRDKYKIVWEIPMKHVIEMAADRGPFVCQSQSMNLWMAEPVYAKLTSMHFYAWEKGLKTGMYYLRRKPKHQAQQFTIEPVSNLVESEQEATGTSTTSVTGTSTTSVTGTSVTTSVTSQDDGNHVCLSCSA